MNKQVMVLSVVGLLAIAGITSFVILSARSSRSSRRPMKKVSFYAEPDELKARIIDRFGQDVKVRHMDIRPALADVHVEKAGRARRMMFYATRLRRRGGAFTRGPALPLAQLDFKVLHMVVDDIRKRYKKTPHTVTFRSHEGGVWQVILYSQKHKLVRYNLQGKPLRKR